MNKPVVRSGMKRICPKCAQEGTFGLMMRECDNCINAQTSHPDAYITENGILRANPDYAEWKASNS